MPILENFFKNSNEESNGTSAKDEEPWEKCTLSGNLPEDLQNLKIIFSNSSDMVYREFQIGGFYNAALVYLSEFSNPELVNSNILKPLFDFKKEEQKSTCIEPDEVNDLLKHVISVSNVNIGSQFSEIVDHILLGEVILLIDGSKKTFFIDVIKIEKRSVEDSFIEPTIRGPHDGFTEDLQTNIGLLRKRLKTPKLKMERMQIGRLSKTIIMITYIKGIANDSLVKEVKDRVSEIDIDAILESGYIEEFIEDNHFSVFPQLGFTDRPDRVAGNLLEGSVGIIIDNTPMALIAPLTFFQGMQSSEDYYLRYFPSFMIRCIRYVFIAMAFALPAFYVALLTFHQGMIPKNLLFTIWSSREAVPFPVLVETLLMEAFFEGLREASVRLPSTAGQMVSIVGGLVIGQAAVQAGLVSSIVVIIVSITGISSFIIPRYNLASSIRVLRFFMIILSGILGFYGMFMGNLIILIHMAKLKSFGIPYLSPVAPLDLTGIKDVFIRAPWWAMTTRPKFITGKTSKRVKNKS